MFALEDMETMHKLTWNELVELEPKLERLLSQVESARPEGKARRNFNWEGTWGHFKNPIADLVGYHRRNGHPALRTNAAYDVAYWKLYHALHD